MTREELLKLGFRAISKSNVEKRYKCSVLNRWFTITEEDPIENVIQQIYDAGVNEGIDIGKEKRSQEIKELLGIYE